VNEIKDKSKLFVSSEDCFYNESRKSIETILSNILNSPNEKKFRKLNEKSNGFRAIFDCKGAREFLIGIGFKEIPPSYLIYENENLDTLKSVYQFVSKDIKEFRNEYKKNKHMEINKKQEFEKESRKKLEEQFMNQRRENENKEIGPSKDVLGDKKGGITRYENIGVDLNKGGG